MTLRVLITGSRSWDNIDYIRNAFRELQESSSEEHFLLVSGECPNGADRLGEIVADELGWDIELHPANWNAHGRPAGFIRNKEMVDLGADIVLGFIRNASKGGSMTVNLAKNANLHTVAHYWNDKPAPVYNVKEFNSPHINILDKPESETLF